MHTCKICGSIHMTSYHHPKFDMLFHECLDCEAIYKDIENQISLIDEKKQYDHHQNSIENEGYVNFLTNFIDSALIPFLNHGTLLDFGSGPKPVLKQILESRYHFDVDIYDYFYKKDDTVFNNTYDGITSTEVFEHLWEPLDIINQLKEILNTNGILAIMTFFHPKDREKFFDWFYIRDPSHVIFYTSKTFEVIANKLGFKVIDTNHFRYITLKKIV